jgi:putative flippase GtrA
MDIFPEGSGVLCIAKIPEKSISYLHLRVALKYTLFALVATAANILSQELSLGLYAGPSAVFVSVMVGTAVGLIVKYLLDKKYIFRFQTRSPGHDLKTFAGYTTMGLLTTGIFWGFEFGFDALFQTREMRYLGGIIGLAIGYYIKYQLDKRLVFVE